jgi:tetratricopeptide (TPR) repeat protein
MRSKRGGDADHRKLVNLLAQADTACLSLNWTQGISLLQQALDILPAALSESKPQLRAVILKSIGHCYCSLGRVSEADKYFAESIQCIEASTEFKSNKEELEPYFDKPGRELPFEIEGLPFIDEPYDGLTVPDALPLLQHMVRILRPHGINVHAWMYETMMSLQEDMESSAHKFLPDYLPTPEIKRLRKPRKYNRDEAVMMRGKDGYQYKLVAPGRLTRVLGNKCKPPGKKRSNKLSAR